MRAAFLLLALGAAAIPGLAADAPRASEADLFGAPAAAAAAPASADAAAGLASELAKPDAFARGDTVADPLQIGGIYYQQWNAQFQDGGSLGSTPWSAPLQLDVFLDARPNDRLRLFVNSRLLYDPTKDQNGNPTQASSSSLVESELSGGTTTTAASNPQALLDQAWLKFDMERTVFITAGKQQVKWGTGHIWNPTDFLNAQRRDPLQPYDQRLGSPMIKAQLPLDSHQSNLYALALFDNPEAASTLQQEGGAFRAETVLFNAELGADAVTRAGMSPQYGADISAPAGPVDAYAEAALLSGPGNASYQRTTITAAPGAPLDSLYKSQGLPGPALQASAGLVYDFAWRDNRQATLGGEYFYNELGVENRGLYPILMFTGRYQALYAAKHYAALYLTAEGPDEGKHTSYTLTNLANVSDGSYESRLDLAWVVLENLTFGAYVAGHYGNQGGEMDFSLRTPALSDNGRPIPAMDVADVPVEGGLSLRMGF
jgi:hypothetical protein